MACPNTCKYKKGIPDNMPTPTCKLIEKYSKEKNPVTKSVLKEIIQKRLRCNNG